MERRLIACDRGRRGRGAGFEIGVEDGVSEVSIEKELDTETVGTTGGIREVEGEEIGEEEEGWETTGGEVVGPVGIDGAVEEIVE